MTLLRHIFLHVGLPKTGTSAIQRSFARNPGLTAARDLLYPAAGQVHRPRRNPGHHNLAYELYSPAQFDENAGGWAAVQREVESSDVSRVLISTEAFREFLAPVVAAKSRKLFPGAAVTVVLYLRPEWEYIESAYNQLARFGQVDQPIGAFWNAVGRDRAKYRRVVEVWQRHFGESNVSCLPFDTPAKRLGPVEHFARNALGFEPGAATACEEARIAALDAGREPGPRIANPKVGMRAIGAVRYARDHYREKTGNPAAALPSRAVARILRNFREAGDDTSQSFMDAALGSLIFAESVETNRWLAERFPAFGSADFMEEPDWTRLRTARTLPEMDRAEKEFCRRVVRLTIKGPARGGRTGAGMSGTKHQPRRIPDETSRTLGARKDGKSDGAGVSASASAGERSYPDSYYAASAHAAPERPALRGEVEADVCVVGAGFTGLSAAIDLAQMGYKVRVLEAARVGWGASGRNGGQIVNGLNAGLDTIGRRYGAGVADFVATVVQEGGEIIRERIARFGIDCDLREGNIFTAFTERQMKELEEKQALWRRHGIDNFEMLDREAVRGHIASDAYLGGMRDRTGAHMHPLNLALGEAAAFESLGGVIHEASAVTRIDDIGGAPVVRTAEGVIRPKTLILAGNAYLGGVVAELDTRIMPFSTQMIATEPLGDRGAELLPTGVCVEDVRYILDYYRLSADGRMLFGGGTVYGGTDPADIRAKIVPNMEKIFPSLKGVGVDFAWSGNCAISFSRVPQMGRIGTSSYFACGYSGHGVVGSHLFGRILAAAIDGDQGRFDTFAKVPWIPFPGGRRFRVPYSMLGSWWYGLRDRLGV